jgi:hypothetical protein
MILVVLTVDPAQAVYARAQTLKNVGPMKIYVCKKYIRIEYKGQKRQQLYLGRSTRIDWLFLV